MHSRAKGIPVPGTKVRMASNLPQDTSLPSAGAFGLTKPRPLSATRLERITPGDVAIRALGACQYPTPVASHLGESALAFVGKADKVLVNDHLSYVQRAEPEQLAAFELAGPRDKVYFDAARVRAGIVTCGGLCPGLNNVIRGLVIELSRGYGVENTLGFRYGYAGMVPGAEADPIALTPENVARIHHAGGTILGSSRGSQEASAVVDRLVELGINVLFVIGGDGTIRGAMKIVAEVERRGLSIAVVGVPKTIDNDIPFIDRSFGFESASSAAVETIHAAHIEATGARDGIGLVKLMGRHSGFVACEAALASTEADLVLIPEVPWGLSSQTGIIAYLRRVLDKKGHAVVVVAEGAGQDLLPPSQQTDKSGNSRLSDIGIFLKSEIVTRFDEEGRDVTLKYIDPSYSIRSVPASPADSVYCWHMARNAVHAAMTGNTGMLIGRWHGRFVHVPMSLATQRRKEVVPDEDLWMSVIESTGQPRSLL